MTDTEEFTAIPIKMEDFNEDLNGKVVGGYTQRLSVHQEYRTVIEKVIREFMLRDELLEEDAYWEIASCAAINIPDEKHFLLIFTGDIKLTPAGGTKTEKGRVSLLSNSKKDKKIYVEEHFDTEEDLNKAINKCLTCLADKKANKEKKKKQAAKERNEREQKLEDDMMKDIYDIPESIADAISQFAARQNSRRKDRNLKTIFFPSR